MEDEAKTFPAAAQAATPKKLRLVSMFDIKPTQIL
jgi:hypothetical protein